MSLNFTKVNYDEDLSELGADELRQLVREYEEAQQSNVADFQSAAERAGAADVDEDTIKDFQEARSDLIDEISEAAAFSQVPLDTEELEGQTFTELQDWQEFVLSGLGETDESGEEDGVSDFGSRAPEGDDKSWADSAAEEALSGLQGISH